MFNHDVNKAFPDSMRKIGIFLSIIIISFLLVVHFSSALISKDSSDPVTKQIFTSLKINDASKTEALITINADEDFLSKEALKVSFNEICGKVKSYQILTSSTCFRNVISYEYEKINVCKEVIIDNKSLETKNVCSDVEQIAKTINTNTSYSCEIPVTTISGVKDYRIKADISPSLCKDGSYGYKIDWMPSITKDSVEYKMSDWAWWNSTWLYKRQINYTGTRNDYNVTLEFTINTSSFGDKLQTNFCDIRFIDENTSTILSVNNWTENRSGNVTFHVLVPTLNTSVYSQVYMYYGNAGAGCVFSPTGLYTVMSRFNKADNSTGWGVDELGQSWVKVVGTANITNNEAINIGTADTAIGQTRKAISSYGGCAGTFRTTTSTSKENRFYCNGNADNKLAVIDCWNGNLYPNLLGSGSLGVCGTNQSYVLRFQFNNMNNWSLWVNGTLNATNLPLIAFTEDRSLYTVTVTSPKMILDDMFQSNKTDFGMTQSLGSEQTLSPEITFISQNPSDILSTTLFSQNVNITYNYTLFTNWQNYLNYTVRSSELSCIEYRNGTCAVLNNTRNFQYDVVINHSQSVFSLDENRLLPQVDLWTQITDDDLWNAPKTNLTLLNDNTYLSMTYKNLSALKYGFLELFASTTGSLGSRVYICNDSYNFVSNPNTNNNCYLFNVFSGSTFNHTHGANSSHRVIVMPFNTSSNSIGGVSLTSKMHILIRGRNAAQVNIRTANFDSGSGIIKTTTNIGLSWTNQTYTPDSHIHQFGASDKVTYFGCANDTGVITCDSTVKSDNYDLTLLPPSVPDVYSPSNISYLIGENISINHTASLSPNLGASIYYNISLLNNDTSFNKTIIGNTNSLINYLNTSGLSSAYYYISVKAIDNYSESSTGFSDKFLLITCVENWVLNPYGDCGTDDLMLKTYNDTSVCNTTNDLPADNGTFEACNYCTEDIVESKTECIGGTQTTSYDDNNFFDCCFITELETDCTILTAPYNTETRSNCTVPTSNVTACEDYNLTVNFSCRYDPEPLLKDKMNIVCLMPDNDTYECVVNVFQDNNLLATTPEYKEATDSLINIKPQTDTRNFFTPEQRLLNAFYTSKSIVTDTPFVVEVLCSSMTSDIKTQVCVTPEYEGQTWVLGRTKWFGDNASLLIWLFIAACVLAIIIFYVIKVARSGY